jgi:hypothetical protein
MSLDLAIRSVTPQEVPRPPVRAAGADRVAGAAPPAPSMEIGPPNPRLRIDRDLGIVVIEFRDSTGKISNTLPTERELRAYRASVNYGAELPPFMDPGVSNATIFAPPSPATQRPVAAPFGSMAFAVQSNFAAEPLKLSA